MISRVKVCCENGKVDVIIFEKDSINVHHLEVYSDDGYYWVMFKLG